MAAKAPGFIDVATENLKSLHCKYIMKSMFPNECVLTKREGEGSSCGRVI
ncbi:hypothetical protein PoMZ_12370 [Pyricularia oryzae]|uniref:Uncharacterized protein n=1 Tax=Pyricularia oryzae TaxID=318829 RepID=A0A4P7NSF7_PYROR|nr:hypothetical protein PoMZ_12370 [Pyricularia oryzae]